MKRMAHNGHANCAKCGVWREKNLPTFKAMMMDLVEPSPRILSAEDIIAAHNAMLDWDIKLEIPREKNRLEILARTNRPLLVVSDAVRIHNQNKRLYKDLQR